MKHEHLLRLSDGREIAFCEFGSATGEAILEFHGNPGTRITPFCSPEKACELGVRWITFDRPGIGRSVPVNWSRRILDVLIDVKQICAALEVREFSVFGYSAGGPYAVACAHGLRGRVKALGLLASIPGLDSPAGMTALCRSIYWRLARRLPLASCAIYGALGTLARCAPGGVAHLMSEGCSAPERKVLNDHMRVERLVATLVEATRQGPRGLVEDMRTLMRPWGFDTTQITAPAIVWCGDADSYVRASAAEWWARTLSAARLVHLPDEGHFLPDELIEQLVVQLRTLASGGPLALPAV